MLLIAKRSSLQFTPFPRRIFYLCQSAPDGGTQRHTSCQEPRSSVGEEVTHASRKSSTISNSFSNGAGLQTPCPGRPAPLPSLDCPDSVQESDGPQGHQMTQRLLRVCHRDKLSLHLSSGPHSDQGLTLPSI